MSVALSPSEQILYDAISSGSPSAYNAALKIVFEAPPVGVREFIESPDYLNKKGAAFDSIIESLEMVFQPHIRETFMEVGRGGGKSFLATGFHAYNSYWLCNLRRPQEFYRRMPNSWITLLNVSVAAVQAQTVVFEEYLGLLEDSPWFTGKFKSLKKSITFPVKRIRAMAGHSGSTVWRGYHVFSGIADEINFFKDKRNRSNAEEMWAVLTGSCQTRFPTSYKLLAISSSRERGDFMDRNIEDAKLYGTEKRFKFQGNKYELVRRVDEQRRIADNIQSLNVSKEVLNLPGIQGKIGGINVP